MFHAKKLQFLLAILVVVVLVIGAVGAGVAMSRFATELSASLLSAKKIKKKRGSGKAALGKIVAQLALPGAVMHPLTVCLFTPPEKPEYKAEVIEDETEAAAGSGEEFEATVYIKNNGNIPWFGDSSGCTGANYVRLGTARERDRASVFFNPADPAWLEPNRIAMVEARVDPGDIATFHFTSRAPKTDDIFREYFQPVVENVRWLESRAETVAMDIYVGQTDAESAAKTLYLGQSGQMSSLDLSAKLVLDVDISEQKLRVKLGDALVREYTVSTGTFRTPTPLGRFKILSKQELRIGKAKPHYRMPQFTMFTRQGAGFHALPYLANDNGIFWNEALSHIGKRASHGCVRLLPEDAVDLYTLTEIDMEVVTHE